MSQLITINIVKNPPYVVPFDCTCYNFSAGDQIKFISGDNAAAAISIPSSSKFLADAFKEGYNEFKMTENDEIIFTAKEGLQSGTYYYHVFMIDQKEFADKPGSSAPKIVIE